MSTYIKVQKNNGRVIGVSQKPPAAEAGIDILADPPTGAGVVYDDASSSVNTDVSLIINDAGTVRLATQSELDGFALDDAKSARKEIAANKSVEIAARGFTFDSAEFSLDPQSQIEWLTLYTVRNETDLMSYPYAVTTRDGGEYFAKNAAKMRDLAVSALAAMRVVSVGERVVTDAVNKASTVALVNAVVGRRS